MLEFQRAGEVAIQDIRKRKEVRLLVCMEDVRYFGRDLTKLSREDFLIRVPRGVHCSSKFISVVLRRNPVSFTSFHPIPLSLLPAHALCWQESLRWIANRRQKTEAERKSLVKQRMKVSLAVSASNQDSLIRIFGVRTLARSSQNLLLVSFR